jgi:hypothetical protein
LGWKLDGDLFTTKETNFFLPSLYHPVRIIYYPDLLRHSPQKVTTAFITEFWFARLPLPERFSSFFCKSTRTWGYLFRFSTSLFPTFSAAMLAQTHGLPHVPRSFATYIFNFLDSRSHRLIYVMGGCMTIVQYYGLGNTEGSIEAIHC